MRNRITHGTTKRDLQYITDLLLDLWFDEFFLTQKGFLFGINSSEKSLYRI
jgi:hypothetical protein